jgi:protein disulfide-isomerase
MKKTLLVVSALVCVVAVALAATWLAEPPLALPVTAHWLSDFSAASAQAKAENKPMLLDFTGSDWCPGCIMLTRDIFDTPQFKDYADKNLVLVTVDFPVHKELPPAITDQNAALQQKFAIEGYPTVILLDSQGNVLSKMLGYNPATVSLPGFIDQLKQAIAKPAPQSPPAAG